MARLGIIFILGIFLDTHEQTRGENEERRYCVEENSNPGPLASYATALTA